jgi:hypothetical protein
VRVFGEGQQPGIFTGSRVECIVVTARLIEQTAKGIFSIDIGFLILLGLLFLTGMLVHAPVSSGITWSNLRATYLAHSPLRISGSAVPFASTPSTSSSPDPIMKST